MICRKQYLMIAEALHICSSRLTWVADVGNIHSPSSASHRVDHRIWIVLQRSEARQHVCGRGASLELLGEVIRGRLVRKQDLLN